MNRKLLNELVELVSHEQNQKNRLNAGELRECITLTLRALAVVLLGQVASELNEVYEYEQKEETKMAKKKATKKAKPKPMKKAY